MKKTKEQDEVQILKMNQGLIGFCVLGMTPLIYNSMSQKVKGSLLLPPRRKNTAERASTLKHEPLTEFRSSMYLFKEKTDTRLYGLAAWFKRALCSAALDIPGAAKAQVARLTWVIGEKVPIFGIPSLRMDVVRMADAARTPDIRSRACLRQWACKITVAHIDPLISQQSVVNLMGAAGVIRGVGDFRPEKGAGNFGQFEIVDPSDKRFQAIIKSGGRDVQDGAIETPEMYDDETAALYGWWQTESKTRGFAAVV